MELVTPNRHDSDVLVSIQFSFPNISITKSTIAFSEINFVFMFNVLFP
jgi:hypothetical protein